MRALRGPNPWADFPVAEVWFDLSDHPPGALLESSAYLRPRLGRLLPGLKRPRRPPIAHDPTRHERWLAQVLLETIVELAARVGERPGFAQVRRTSEPGVYRLAFQWVEGLPAEACAEAALTLVAAALTGDPCDTPALLEGLAAQAREHAPTPTCAALLKAARARGIPARRLPGDMLQLGYGARQRRPLCTTVAASDPATLDRDLFDTLLAATGLACTEAPVSDAHYRVLVTGRRVLAALWWQPGRSDNGRAPIVTDVSGLLHGEVRARALDAVRALGLETAEVRLAVADITRPLESQGGRVSEVIPSPPLDLYLDTVRSRSIADAFLDTLYRPGETGRIPDRGRLRHQRQDHRDPPDRPWAQRVRPLRGDDLHRRHLSGRPADRYR